MSVVHTSRAFYNSSFNKRIVKYAKIFALYECNTKQHDTVEALVMLSEFTSLSFKEIKQTKPNEQAMNLNLELLEYEDEVK